MSFHTSLKNELKTVNDEIRKIYDELESAKRLYISEISETINRQTLISERINKQVLISETMRLEKEMREMKETKEKEVKEAKREIIREVMIPKKETISFSLSNDQYLCKKIVSNSQDKISILGVSDSDCKLYIRPETEIYCDASGNIGNIRIFEEQTNSITFNGKKWLACGNGTSGTVAFSDDGINWRIDSSALTYLKNQATKGIFTNNEWIICGSSGLIIGDEGSWRNIISGQSCKDLISHNGQIVALFDGEVLIGDDRKGDDRKGDDRKGDDAELVWTPKKIQDMDCYMSLAECGNNIIVTGMGDKNICCINDGEDFSQRVGHEVDFSTDKLQIVNSLAYHPKYGFVAGGYVKNKIGIIHSTNGKDWEIISGPNMEIQINKVVWLTDKFIAMGDGGSYWSRDGIHWHIGIKSESMLTDISLPLYHYLKKGKIDVDIEMNLKRGDLILLEKMENGNECEIIIQ